LTGTGPASIAAPAVDVNCYQSTTTGFWYHYCVHKAEASTSQDVIYYFHGIRGSEYEWESSPYFSQIYTLWGNAAPIVVSVSYGSTWLLAERNGSRYSGLYENFVTVALPSIESSRNIHPAHRMLMGLSMGGFNAAQVYLKNPELFTKVGLACPAITTVGPYSDADAIGNYTARTHALSSYVNNALYLSSEYFPNATAWSEADPIALANARLTPNYPALYVSGGLQDEYGFFEGAAQFATIASSHGVSATWVPLPGRHCTFDWEGTARFFIAQ
jgi:S-formylglutathione hydrolase FrmB